MRASPRAGEIARAGEWSSLDTCLGRFSRVSEQDIDRLKTSIREKVNPPHHRQLVANAILTVGRITEEAIIVAHEIIHSRPEAPPIFVLVLGWLFFLPRLEPGPQTEAPLDFGCDPLLDRTRIRMKWVRRIAPQASG